MLTRRNLLGFVPALIAAPAIIRVANLMPVKVRPLVTPSNAIIVKTWDYRSDVIEYWDYGRVFTLKDTRMFTVKNPVFIRV